ncbi:secreted lipoprotein [Bacillus safensis]|nr:secreted lipoprotein [Bacillus safensis]
MKNTIKIICVLVLVLFISVMLLILQLDKKKESKDAGGKNIVEEREKSDQEIAEDFAEKMKPKVEEHLHKRDIHNFIKTITFEKDVTINPMGDITIDGYINNKPEKYGFSASLQYRAKKIGSMSYDPELSYRFKDWDKFKDEPELKENYLKRLSEKEREQYLKDIGEKE